MMAWIVVAILGAGAARAVWSIARGYERMASARDELDDSLHCQAPDHGQASADNLPGRTPHAS